MSSVAPPASKASALDFIAHLARVFAAAAAPLEDMTVSQCADRWRVLPPKAAEPGKFKTDRVPYLRGIQDALGDNAVNLVVIMKCTQAAISEAVRSAMHYWVRQDPGECLWVFPDQNSVRKTFKKHLKPMVELSLLDFLKGDFNDVTYENLTFRTMDVTAAWSGSPQTLSGDSYRYVVCDETDKYPEFSGRDSDPIALADARTRTYTYRAKNVILSSPTVSSGAIARAFKSVADQRYFWVPCLACSKRQILTWQQVKYPSRPDEVERIDWAERVNDEQLATYECIGCGHPHSDAERLEMVEAGVWLDKNGDTPKGARKVAFQISSLYSPWSNLSALAEKWIKAQGHLNLLMQFYNQELGEPFEQRIASVDGDVFARKAEAGHPRHLVPAWAGLLIASADAQKDGFWYVLRAWGRGHRSRLIDHGFAHDEEHLRDLTLGRRLPIEGCDDSGQTMAARWLFVDAGGGVEREGTDGTTTHLVYSFSLSDPRIIACKGHGGRSRPARELRVKPHTYKPKAESVAPYEVLLATIDTQFFKDLIKGRIDSSDQSIWELHQEVDEDYCKQMSSEHKVFERRGASAVQIWKPISEGRANHLWDCEVYNAAAAEYAEVAFLPSEDELKRERAEIVEARRSRSARPQSPGLTDPYGRPFFATDR